ncbi:hypothetical protein [Clostridium sp. HBUAS56010]|uniref:hypothetical protein n=1 Tax=Clostridium sp. HBUAS56010 TaxID=2571127 RepID=UPI0011777DBF|nr:hypothetical protein [Clostridium sp. HBUAS56010]
MSIVENVFINIITFFGTLPGAGFEILSSLVHLVIIYVEILILFMVLTQQFSKKCDKWIEFKKSFYIYTAVGIILERLLLFLSYSVFAILVSSVLETIIITVFVKIIISFSFILILYKVSFKKKKYFGAIKQIYLLILQ